MYIPFLHLLDRNAVSLIKESNAGKIQTDATKIGFLQKLRRLDRKQDYVSPLLSIIEGEHGRADTVEEKMAAQWKESDAVRHFFKSAQTDSDFSTPTVICLARHSPSIGKADGQRGGRFSQPPHD